MSELKHKDLKRFAASMRNQADKRKRDQALLEERIRTLSGQYGLDTYEFSKYVAEQQIKQAKRVLALKLFGLFLLFSLGWTVSGLVFGQAGWFIGGCLFVLAGINLLLTIVIYRQNGEL